jgi:ClpP class serine protease
MSGDDEDFIVDEFEWALKDPTEEKLRALGDVVSTITKKLVDAIGDLDKRLYDLETKLNGIDSKVNQIASGAGGGLMGELKTLLAARRRKADASSE